MDNIAENSVNNTFLITEYIKALIQHIDHPDSPDKINLIFDGGAFNIGFAAGTALYIKSLEKNNKLQINQISGCSSGALIALWYTCGCDPTILSFFEKMMYLFKTEFSFHHIHSIIIEAVNHIFNYSEDEYPNSNTHTPASNDKGIINMNLLNNKLFINYYDTRKNKQKIVSNYKNKNHLIRCLMRTIHIPYIIDGNSKCHKRYIDGIIPYTFNNSPHNSLLIKLCTLKNYSKAFILKREKNVHQRLFIGVSDANDFFTKGRSDMCVYIKNQSYIDTIFFRGREILIVFIFTIIEWTIFIKDIIPSGIKDSLLYNGIINTFKSIIMDFLQRILV